MTERADVGGLDERALEAAIDAHLAWRGEPRVAGQDFGEQERDILRQQAEAAIHAYLASLRTGEAEPTYWAVHSKTGMHIGLWPDKADADKALREYEGGTLTPLFADHGRLSRALAKALQERDESTDALADLTLAYVSEKYGMAMAWKLNGGEPWVWPDDMPTTIHAALHRAVTILRSRAALAPAKTEGE